MDSKMCNCEDGAMRVLHYNWVVHEADVKNMTHSLIIQPIYT